MLYQWPVRINRLRSRCRGGAGDERHGDDRGAHAQYRPVQVAVAAAVQQAASSEIPVAPGLSAIAGGVADAHRAPVCAARLRGERLHDQVLHQPRGEPPLPAGGCHGVGVGGGLGPAAIEQVFADLVDGPLTHLPSGRFAADATRPTCAAIAHNLLPTATHLTRRHGCEG